jgi:hypothetical protein
MLANISFPHPSRFHILLSSRLAEYLNRGTPTFSRTWYQNQIPEVLWSKHPADQPTELPFCQMGRCFPCSRVCVEESVGSGILFTVLGGMSMRDNVLPRQRLELYRRLETSSCPFLCYLRVNPLDRFVQPPKSQKATSDSWTLTRLSKQYLKNQDAPSPHDPDQIVVRESCVVQVPSVKWSQHL